MSSERWRWKPSSGASPSPVTLLPPAAEPVEIVDSKKPRVLTKALRSLSNSSIDSTAGSLSRSTNSIRRLQKSSSSSGSMMERLHRRVSKDSAGSFAMSEAPPSPLDCSYASMEVILHTSLRREQSSSSRSEYLVLTDHSVTKFSRVEAAQLVFPQLDLHEPQLQRSSSSASLQSKVGQSEILLEIPHTSIVAVFSDGYATSRNDLDIWWASRWPRVSYCRTQLSFASAQELDEWLAAIHRTCRARMRTSSVLSAIPENLRTRIHQIVQSTENAMEDPNQIPVFPVVRRTSGAPSKSTATVDARNITDLSSFYLALGPCMCYLIEILKTDASTAAAELRAKVISFGAVTLTRFRASVATHTQSFAIGFRPPFGRDARLDLASVHYRRIIETMMKVDRVVKPMWPQQLQQSIFDIRGLPPPLQLTSGNDLGGLETSLPAYCTAYQVPVPRWSIEWNEPSQPCFRLHPLKGEGYSVLQLLAVFRALRFNSFFKAISFENVDLTTLTWRYDEASHGDSIVHTSANLLRLSDDHYEGLLEASVLEQEMHSLLFASDSLRSINFTNVLGLRSRRHSHLDLDNNQPATSEFLRPLLTLLRRQLCHCHSISLAGNPIAASDVDDLANVLVLDYVRVRRLDLSNCMLGESDLSKLWIALEGQGDSIEALDLSYNRGIVKFDVVRDTLSKLKSMKKLSIAKNTRFDSHLPLLDPQAMSEWPLQELDLSDMTLNDATVDVIAGYLATAASQNLRTLRLNNCGLSATQISLLLNSMGRGREIEMHINSSSLDDGIEDMCKALTVGNGPWCLFAQMVDFGREESYVDLLRALTLNDTVQCLSLAGASIPDDASETACQAVFDFFSQNSSVRYLDISGYDSKLDDGRLGRGFSRALRGIKSNKKIEHLRVRSQLLNFNVGDLAEAIAGNETLKSLDCEANDFNLSNFRHLIKHLEMNKSIRHLSAFSEQELDQTIQKSISHAAPATQMRRTSVMSRFKHDKGQVGNDKALVQDLQEEWSTAVSMLKTHLGKAQAPSTSDLQSFSKRTSSSPLDSNSVFSEAFGGLALDDYEFQRHLSVSYSNEIHQGLDRTHEKPLDQCVQRSSSTGSSDSHESSNMDRATNTSSLPSPEELDELTEARPRYHTVPHASDHTYFDAQDVDLGLQMRKYQRFCGDPDDRIDEEEAGHL